jgi:hypothetical protein
LNGSLSPGTATYGVANNAHKKHLKDAHQKIIDAAQLAKFNPLDMPDPPHLIVSNLLEDYEIDNPISFFELFFGDEQYELLTTNTNKYARAYPTIFPEKRRRGWVDVTVADIKVYIALLMWFGLYRHKDPHSH